jgi:hypothetical protein
VKIAPRAAGGRLIEIAARIATGEAHADDVSFLTEFGQELMRSSFPVEARNRRRDFWMAIDYHTRTGRNRAKLVAREWGVEPDRVETIASRGKDECARALAEKPARWWRALLAMER